jgi:glc operon protein GlcG
LSSDMAITLEDAQRLIQKAHEKAAQLSVRVTVAVVDEGGRLVALGRMDGAPPISPRIAEAKAAGAALFLRDGASLLQTAQDRPVFYNAAERLAGAPIVPGPGSLLIHKGKQVVGAVGVSGGKPEQDLECAEAGLASL